MNRHSALILALVFVVACSGDDEGGTPAGAGGVGGGTGGVGGGTGGVGGGTGGMGGGTGGVGGGTGGVGGMSGGMGGMTGGMGGMDMDEDGGIEDSGVDAEVDAEVDAGVDAEVDAGPDAGGNTGEEGAQNGACRQTGSACDDGLGCYQPDVTLPGFCTLECTDDDDCDGLSDATWTCFTNEGLCRVACDPGNGNDDCPAGFQCADVFGNDRCVPMD